MRVRIGWNLGKAPMERQSVLFSMYGVQACVWSWLVLCFETMYQSMGCRAFSMTSAFFNWCWRQFVPQPWPCVFRVLSWILLVAQTTLPCASDPILLTVFSMSSAFFNWCWPWLYHSLDLGFFEFSVDSTCGSNCSPLCLRSNIAGWQFC